jgi:hypothetical protein
MAYCELCYNLDLEHLAGRDLPPYYNFLSNELGMSFEALDKSKDHGCTIFSLLRKGAELFSSDLGNYDDYSHLSLATKILEGQSVIVRLQVMGTTCAEIEFFGKLGRFPIKAQMTNCCTRSS